MPVQAAELSVEPSRSARQRRQRRRLIISTAINCLGNGAYLPMALLLLTSLTRLSLAEVGGVLTGAEFMALALMPGTGVVIDRIGAGRVQTACHLLRSVGFAAYPLTHSTWTFAAAAFVVAAGERSSRVAGPALIAETLEGRARERYLVLDRALSNAGLGVGGVVAAALLAVGGTTAYLLVAATVSLAFALAAASTFTMKCLTCGGRDIDVPSRGWLPVLADSHFRLLTLANTCAAFGYVALAMVVPLYAVRELHLPAALGGGLFTLNTIICAAVSVPLTSRLQRRGLTSMNRAVVGLGLMAAGFGLMAAAAHVDRALAAGAMIGAVAVYTLGEIAHSPAATSLAFEAMPAADRGHYLAIYQLSWALASAAAPALFSTLVVSDPLLLLVGLIGLDALAVGLMRHATGKRKGRPASPHSRRHWPLHQTGSRVLRLARRGTPSPLVGACQRLST